MGESGHGAWNRVGGPDVCADNGGLQLRIKGVRREFIQDRESPAEIIMVNGEIVEILYTKLRRML